MPAQLGSLNCHPPHDPHESRCATSSKLWVELDRMARPLQRAADCAHSLEIGARLVDRLQDPPVVLEDLSARPARDEVETAGALVAMLQPKGKVSLFPLKPARQLRGGKGSEQADHAHGNARGFD